MVSRDEGVSRALDHNVCGAKGVDTARWHGVSPRLSNY